MSQLSVTALFYLEDSRKIHLQGMRARRSKDMRRRTPQCAGERERELALAPPFICFSLPGPVLCKLGQPGMLLVLPEVLTPVLGPSFVLFLRAFPFLVFWPPPFWTLFPSLPNKHKDRHYFQPHKVYILVEETGIDLSIKCILTACDHGRGGCTREPGLVSGQGRFPGEGGWVWILRS